MLDTPRVLGDFSLFDFQNSFPCTCATDNYGEAPRCVIISILLSTVLERPQRAAVPCVDRRPQLEAVDLDAS
jgi:hypothetical protein